ncbi:MAG: glycosyltransferase family 2 protein [Flavobacteriales bacterium]|nr:glycosyltransferase family 2 protein [Flavobacteriales bacterium]
MRLLSVVIITHNEERNLGRCLASVMEVADDVVVVDSFSTDGTEAIAREHGARFVQHAFEGHIEQKNWAITQARHPFILSLDADEALDPELARNVALAKQEDLDGYTMNRLTNYCGTWVRHGGWYPDVKLRLWNSTKGAWTGTNPHDRYALASGSRTRHLSGDILHYSYYSISDHLRQVDYFTAIMSRALHARGTRASSVKLFLSPVAKFLGDYLFRGGFLDGWHGFVIARISAQATFLKYAKLRELERTEHP